MEETTEKTEPEQTPFDDFDVKALKLTIPTAKKVIPFLTALSIAGNITEAAKAAGFSRQTAHHYFNIHPTFKAAWHKAVEMGNAALIDEAKTRALDKDDEKSSLLLIFSINRNDKIAEKRGGTISEPTEKYLDALDKMGE